MACGQAAVGTWEEWPDSLPSLLAPLEALALLLADFEHEGHQADSFAHSAAKGLSSREADAISEFASAAQRCLARLSGGTLHLLESVGSLQRALSRNNRKVFEMPQTATPATARSPTSQTEQTERQKSVCDLFMRYDSDNDGSLSESEFRQAFKKFTGGSLTDAQVDKMVRAVDVNQDGVIDIFEFTVWLYSTDEETKPQETKRQGCSPTEELARLREEVSKLKAELKVKSKAVEQSELQHEEELKVTHDFWRSVAQHAVLTIDQKVDLQDAAWLGNGKYGFVMKARRREDGREMVLKMMGIRWAHLAVKEWQHGAMIGKHPNIVEYDEVMIHADDDMTVRNMITLGYARGSLKSKANTTRTRFPDRYICLTQEYMNAGSIQDWIDDDQLRPGGMFVVMRNVAAALAFLHNLGVTHNDIKPENVMVNQGRAMVNGEAVVVKLGDLGLTARSSDRSADFWQYGMTVFCMTTGERFGSRKYRPQVSETFVNECRQACESAQPNGRLRQVLFEVPGILREVFSNQVSMAQVSQLECLQRWSFFDEGERCVSREAGNLLSRPARERSTQSNADLEAMYIQRVVGDMSPKMATPAPGG